jgi:hypothetical protein
MEEPRAQPETPPEVAVESAVLWGDSWELKSAPVRVSIGKTRLSIERAGERLLRIVEIGGDPQPTLAAVGPEEGRLRFGHVRRKRPVILRVPKPIRLGPRARASIYSTYPVQGALFFETPGGERFRLIDVARRPMRKTWYGDPAAGTLCDLHFGPSALKPGELEADPLAAAVRLDLDNRSDEPRSVGIFLIDPPATDFYALERKLCLNAILVKIHSADRADVDYLAEPSLAGAELVERRRRETNSGAIRDLLRHVMGEHAMGQGY